MSPMLCLLLLLLLGTEPDDSRPNWWGRILLWIRKHPVASVLLIGCVGSLLGLAASFLPPPMRVPEDASLNVYLYNPQRPRIEVTIRGRRALDDFRQEYLDAGWEGERGVLWKEVSTVLENGEMVLRIPRTPGLEADGESYGILHARKGTIHWMKPEATLEGESGGDPAIDEYRFRYMGNTIRFVPATWWTAVKVWVYWCVGLAGGGITLVWTGALTWLGEILAGWGRSQATVRLARRRRARKKATATPQHEVTVTSETRS